MPARKHPFRERKTGQFVGFFPLMEPRSSKIRRTESFSTRDNNDQKLQNSAGVIRSLNSRRRESSGAARARVEDCQASKAALIS
jgi:hypothetical protein